MYYSLTLIEQMENNIINADTVFEGESAFQNRQLWLLM